MDLEELIADDMDFFDFLQAGIYRSRTDGEVYEDYEDIVCLRQDIDTKNANVSVAKAQQDRATWHAKAKDFTDNDITPHLRDRIVDEDDVEWWVEDFALETLGTRYRFTCTKVKAAAV